MRDIRTELRERLAAIAGRYADALSEYDRQLEALEQTRRNLVEALDRECAALEVLLAIEDQRAGVTPAEIEVRRTARLLPLADFLTTKVHAHGPMDKDELRREADLAGYFAEGDGRTFHTTLMNISKGGRLIRLSDGRFAFPQREQSSPDFQSEEEIEKTLM
jgi:hypothetical protein